MVEKNNIQKNLCILMPSCDKYNSLWPFTQKEIAKNKILNKLNFYLSTNTLNSKYGETIKVGRGKKWGDDILHAIERIDEEYILILLDDLLINEETIDNDFLEYIVKNLETIDPDFIGLVNFMKKEGDKGDSSKYIIKKISKWIPYRCSLMPAIWRKSTLKELVKSSESAWEFEKRGSNRSKLFKRWFRTKTTVIGTYNLIIKGKIYNPSIEKSNLNKNLLNFPSQGKVEFIMFKINTFKHFIFKLIFFKLLENSTSVYINNL